MQYWVREWEDEGPTYLNVIVSHPSSNYIAIIGRDANFLDNNTSVVFYDIDGNFISYVMVDGGSATTNLSYAKSNLIMDADGNVLLTAGTANGEVYKVTPEGRVTMRRSIDTANDIDLMLLPNGNIVGCYEDSSTNIAYSIFSGDLQSTLYGTYYTGEGTLQYAKNMVCDSSNNIYSLTQNYYGAGPETKLVINKFDSTLTLLSSVEFGLTDAVTNQIPTDSDANIAINNATGDIYISYLVLDSTNSYYYIQLIKFNSSFVVQWEKGLRLPSTQAFFNPYVSINEATGDVFVTCTADAVNINYRTPIVWKLDSSGTTQFTQGYRLIVFASVNSGAIGSIVKNNALYIASEMTTESKGCLAKVSLSPGLMASRVYDATEVTAVNGLMNTTGTDLLPRTSGGYAHVLTAASTEVMVLNSLFIIG